MLLGMAIKTNRNKVPFYRLLAHTGFYLASHFLPGRDCGDGLGMCGARLQAGGCVVLGYRGP